jgi:hypothetical protein
VSEYLELRTSFEFLNAIMEEGRPNITNVDHFLRSGNS